MWEMISRGGRTIFSGTDGETYSSIDSPAIYALAENGTKLTVGARNGNISAVNIEEHGKKCGFLFIKNKVYPVGTKQDISPYFPKIEELGSEFPELMPGVNRIIMLLKDGNEK